MGPPFQRFEATEFSAHWYLSLDTRGDLLAMTHLFTEEARDGFIERGMADPGGHPVFLFAVHDRSARSLDIRVGDIALAPQPLRRAEHARSAQIPAALIQPLLSNGGTMTITFYGKERRIVLRSAVPVALITDSITALPPMYRLVREKLADMANRCDMVLTVVG